MFITITFAQEDNSEQNLKEYVSVLQNEIDNLNQIILNNDKLREVFQEYKNKIQEIQNEFSKNILFDSKKIEKELLSEHFNIYFEIQKLINQINATEDCKNIITTMENYNQLIFEKYSQLRQSYINLNNQLEELRIKNQSQDLIIESLKSIIENIHISIGEMNQLALRSTNENSNVALDYKDNQIKELTATIDELKSQLESFQSSMNEMQRIIINYENLNLGDERTHNQIREILKYIIDKYENISSSKENIFYEIEKLETIDVIKNQLREMVLKIENDQSIKNINFALVSYGSITRDFYNQISNLNTTDVAALQSIIVHYLTSIDNLKIESINITNNQNMLRRCLGIISSKKYKNSNLQNDIMEIKNSLLLDVGNVKLVEYDSYLKKEHTNIQEDLNYQLKLVISLVTYFEIFEISSSRSKFDKNLKKYNEYAVKLNNISKYKYKQFDKCPNGEIVKNLHDQTILKIEEVIKYICKIPKEHEVLTNAGLIFKNIVGEENQPTVEYVKKTLKENKVSEAIVNIFRNIDTIMIFLSNK